MKEEKSKEYNLTLNIYETVALKILFIVSSSHCFCRLLNRNIFIYVIDLYKTFLQINMLRLFLHFYVEHSIELFWASSRRHVFYVNVFVSY